MGGRRLREVETGYRRGPGAAGEAQAAHRTIYDMKGQGGTFGYPLVTDIRESLCRFMDGVEVASDVALEVVEAPFGALSAVILNDVKGDGGEIGCEVTRGLRAAVDKLRAGPGRAAG